ncbi:unnamed protein product [Notodromas monacha]|uniref:Tudor domain-containing protein n=1 Tax=Notodromas monacha TaxID=399045 RepID=A0A7R9BSI3_9CRUS|nr:unnamed protein product [Notodromas monacha]CAG0920915.1 unnamed protein product [Notodromas monacha]
MDEFDYLETGELQEQATFNFSAMMSEVLITKPTRTPATQNITNPYKTITISSISMHDCLVTSISSQDDFWVQLAENALELEELMLQISSSTKLVQMPLPKIGDPCLFMVTPGLVLRGLIVETDSSLSVSVVAVDFGCIQEVLPRGQEIKCSIKRYSRNMTQQCIDRITEQTATINNSTYPMIFLEGDSRMRAIFDSFATMILGKPIRTSDSPQVGLRPYKIAVQTSGRLKLIYHYARLHQHTALDPHIDPLLSEVFKGGKRVMGVFNLAYDSLFPPPRFQKDFEKYLQHVMKPWENANVKSALWMDIPPTNPPFGEPGLNQEIQRPKTSALSKDATREESAESKSSPDCCCTHDGRSAEVLRKSPRCMVWNEEVDVGRTGTTNTSFPVFEWFRLCDDKWPDVRNLLGTRNDSMRIAAAGYVPALKPEQVQLQKLTKEEEEEEEEKQVDVEGEQVSNIAVKADTQLYKPSSILDAGKHRDKAGNESPRLLPESENSPGHPVSGPQVDPNAASGCAALNWPSSRHEDDPVENKETFGTENNSDHEMNENCRDTQSRLMHSSSTDRQIEIHNELTLICSDFSNSFPHNLHLNTSSSKCLGEDYAMETCRGLTFERGSTTAFSAALSLGSDSTGSNASSDDEYKTSFHGPSFPSCDSRKSSNARSQFLESINVTRSSS